MPGCVLATPLHIYGKFITVRHILPEETFATYYGKLYQVVEDCSSGREVGKDVMTPPPHTEYQKWEVQPAAA